MDEKDERLNKNGSPANAFEESFDEKDTILDIYSDVAGTHSDRNFKQALRHSFASFFSIHDDVAEHKIIRDRIRNAGKITGTNAMLLVFAILIASIGLNSGSVAVIIGAMLISPLMGTIQAIGYGVASADKKFTLSSIKGLLFQVIVAFLVSTLYFLISPVKAPTAELLARTRPTVFDILVAIIGGLAGIIAQTRESQYSNVVPGVAIATALMPPICTAGYSLANGQFAMLAGAGYLFAINTYFIFASSVVILTILNVPKMKELSEKDWRKMRRLMYINTIIVSIPAIVLSILIGLKII